MRLLDSVKDLLAAARDGLGRVHAADRRLVLQLLAAITWWSL